MTIGQRLQGAVLGAVFAALRALGPERASNLGGAVARRIGPFLPSSRTADANLRAALPELGAAARRRVVREVWDSLGRTVGELPHLPALLESAAGPGWELAGRENVERAVAAGRPILFYSGHLANWELLLPAAGQWGIPLSGIYRAPSNPAVDAAIGRLREAAIHPDATMYAKGAKGAKAVVRHLASGRSLGLLIDQKMNDGIPVPFFGRPAMTAPALAQLAHRFGCILLPVRIERLAPARFRITVEPPFKAPQTGDRAADTLALMTRVNADLERWIRARPGSWLWLHRRWPKA